ncbi:MAG TPA: TIGR03067 domain-containing protein [Gemmataceae bacterium]|nr:TIGR03067 domain-containing protein [Gemmataceae bacterium]
MLRSRLVQKGAALAGLVPVIAHGAELPVLPAPMLFLTVQTVRHLTKTTRSAISPSVLSLADEVLTPMYSKKLFVAATSLVVLGLTIPGALLFAHFGAPGDDAKRPDENLPVALVQDKKAPVPAEDPVGQEHKNLEGLWKFDANESEDKEWGIMHVPLKTIQKGTLEIRAKSMTWTYPDFKYTISFKLDPSKPRKEIDITFLDGKRKGKTYQGIYRLEKRNAPLAWLLWICLRDDAHAELGRPERSAFTSGNLGLSLILLRRLPQGQGPVAAPVKKTPAPAKEPVSKELQPFQGYWKMTLCDSEAELLDVSQQEVSKCRWTIEGDEITWGRKGEEWKVRLHVDPSKTPKEIDLTFLSGPLKGQKCLGMYEWGGIDGKSFNISIQDPGSNVPRPTRFAFRGGGRTSMISLRQTTPIDSGKEMSALQGTWIFALSQTDAWPNPIGKGPDKTGQGSERKWIVKGKEIIWTSPDGQEIKASFTIDAHKVPRHIDLMFLSGPHKGVKCEGVYESASTDGKGLWLCFVDPGAKVARPKDISYKSHSGRSMILLRRYETAAEQEQRLLQGVWKFAVCQSAWWPVNRPTMKAAFPKWRWTVKENEMSWTGVSTGDVKVSFTIDPTTSPKRIDFTFLDGPQKGQKCLGIYRIKGGSLWVCLQDPGMKVGRPTDFSYDASEARSLLILDPVDKK